MALFRCQSRRWINLILQQKLKQLIITLFSLCLLQYIIAGLFSYISFIISPKITISFFLCIINCGLLVDSIAFKYSYRGIIDSFINNKIRTCYMHGCKDLDQPQNIMYFAHFTNVVTLYPTSYHLIHFRSFVDLLVHLFSSSVPCDRESIQPLVSSCFHLK